MKLRANMATSRVEAGALKERLICAAMLGALLLPSPSALPQIGPEGGVYQILSGNYIECCGFGGPVISSLPNANQAFIKLAVSAGGNLATLTILGEDGQTVFSVTPCLSDAPFRFTFEGGFIDPQRIIFHADPGPPPYYAFWNYTVSNTASRLRLSGISGFAQNPCADVPDQFTHSNIVAVLMPTTAIRVSEVEVCWTTATNVTYQLQWRSPLSSDQWTDLGPPRPGDGSVNCIADKVPPDRPQRFYRVLPLP